MKFVHVNIISRDWKKLADFYTKVFECVPLWPERDLSGDWMDKATSIKDVHISGVHLRLPGFEEGSPTLEIFQYDNNSSTHPKKINTEGLSHLAFRVDDVQVILKRALANGGIQVGDLTKKEIKGLGTITFVYLTDPEGNIVEVQNWA
ncbi:MAG: glyoxalase [Bacteroidetes bacterium HGW-Bacteroidetes-17]|jgi:predicted enzyme related to lactoylglutathione lyase|nr:MAG: glyoxalase [Bacteroidetes bacterium HGW-Bacteroidetes-17]